MLRPRDQNVPGKFGGASLVDDTLVEAVKGLTKDQVTRLHLQLCLVRLGAKYKRLLTTLKYFESP